MILILGAGRLAQRIQNGDPEIFVASRQHLNVVESRDVAKYLSHAATAGIRVVVNTAANTNVGAVEVDRASGTNSVGPGIVALACAAYGLKLIHISTDYVFGGGGVKGPYRASDRPFPLQHYGRSKLLGEWATAFLPGTVIVRIGWIFGPEYPLNAAMLAATAANRLDQRLRDNSHEELSFDIWNDILGTPTFVGEAARMVRALAKVRAHYEGELLDLPPIVHVSSGEKPISWYEFLKNDYPLITPGSSPPTLRRPRVGGLVPTEWGRTASYETMLGMFREELSAGLKSLGPTSL